MVRRAYIADFGAGNTGLFWVNPDASVHGEAAALNAPGGEPSGYAAWKQGETLLGLGMYGLRYDQLKDIDHIHINLKERPTEGNQAELVRYFKNWLVKVQKDHPEEFANIDKKYWFIGCPTGEAWKKEETQKLYKGIFEEAGYDNVHIVPESSAALAFYQKRDGILDSCGKDTRLLLIDQGAYSLDATHYGDGEVTSYGGYLGASLIERMMVHAILYSNEQDIRLKKKMINLPEIVEKARTLYEQEGPQGKFYAYLLFHARKLKEDYFSAEKGNALLSNVDMKRELDFNVEEDPLTLFVNPILMRRILEEKPVREILGAEFDALAREVQEEISDKTWMQAFGDFLNRLDKVYPDLRDSGDVVIMMTGGGAMMKCVSEAVKAHYPKASFHCDDEAISAIGKGMAYWAPDKVKAVDLEEAFSEVIFKEEIDGVWGPFNAVASKILNLFNDCVSKYSDDFEEAAINAFNFSVRKWCRFACSNAEISKIMEGQLLNWGVETGTPAFIKNMERRIADLKKELNAQFKETAETHGFRNLEFLRENDKALFSKSKEDLTKLSEEFIRQAAKACGTHKSWAEFPEAGFNPLLDVRNMFYIKNRTALSQTWAWEIAQQKARCEKIFCEDKRIGDEENRCSLEDFFIKEGMDGLRSILKRRVKEILGKLVLEEYID